MTRRCLTSNTAPPHAAAASAALPPVPHLRWDIHGPPVKVAVAGNIVVAVSSSLPSSGASSSRREIKKKVALGATAARTSPSGASSPCTSPQASGVGREDILALPVYVHGASAEESGVGGGDGKLECAVCICELRDGDTGRLLPRCGHRFHAECVDRWFRSHATCPLCRAVVADGGYGEPDPKVQPAGV